MFNWKKFCIVSCMACGLSTSCKPRFQNGRNGVIMPVGNDKSGASLTQDDSDVSNHRNLLAGISMVTQGALQTPPGPGNPEVFGVPEPQNFSVSNWDKSFKINSQSGLLDLAGDAGKSDSIQWSWSSAGKSYTGRYVVDRRKIGDKRFLLLRLCKLEGDVAPPPNLFSFCGISEIEKSGLLAKTWTLCSGFSPECR